MVLEDVPHRTGGDMGELLGRRNDDGLDVRGQAAVRVGDGALGLEVDHVPDTADDVVDAQFVAGVDGEVAILDDRDAGKPLRSLPDDVEPLLHVEEAALVLVDTHGDDHFVEHREGTLENVQMTGRERVERAGEQGFRFHNCQLIGVFPSDRRMMLVCEKWRQPKKAPPASGEGCAAVRT